MQIVCTCDVCGRQFDNITEAKQHEADCYGLSQYEYVMWRNLVEIEADCRPKPHIYGGRLAQFEMASYEDKRDRLLRFEQTHHLDGMPKPSDWKLREENWIWFWKSLAKSRLGATETAPPT